MSHSYDHGGNVFAVARTLGVAADQILDYSASINPLGMSPMVRKALICSFDNLMHYPDTGHLELKLELARYHALSPEHFTVANGSTELIYKLPALLTGSKALIVSPSFSEYERALNQHQWQIRHYTLTPENSFSIDTDTLSRELDDGVDALFLCNPGNPSGMLYPPHIVEKICGMCTSAGSFLVLDEAFMDFCEDASAKHMIVQNDNAIVLRSMTKFFSIPGLRLGYAISNAALAERLDEIGGPWSVNTMAQVAGVAALQDVQHNRTSLETIRQERKHLFEGLEQFNQLRPFPSNANYLLVEINGNMSARELKERLLPFRIMIRDCAGFMGLTGRFFRVAVRSGKENKYLVECLGRIFNGQNC